MTAFILLAQEVFPKIPEPTTMLMLALSFLLWPQRTTRGRAVRRADG
jgi:hypothetical protein